MPIPRTTVGMPVRNGERDVAESLDESTLAVPSPRVGLFGLLGSGNLGNDASCEVVLDYLRKHQPDALVDAMCMGPEHFTELFGIDAVPTLWYRRHDGRTSGLAAVALKLVGKVIDAFRTADWVRRHDVVIVPGMGVLEASLPLRASGTPYAMFLLCASGKLFRTKVALVSVGAGTTRRRMTRWLFGWAARLAYYRSYRDVPSREAMRQRGVDTVRDRVYPDLVFGLRTPQGGSGDERTVGVGLMAYHGGNDDRPRRTRIYADYIEAMKLFVRWLVDHDHRVRLFWGDDVDQVAVDDILADLRQNRPDLAPGSVVADPFSSLRELMEKMETVNTVVGTRFHTVLSGLKLAKPTIAIGYAVKFDALMSDMGMLEFSQSALSIDVERLISQFRELEAQASEIRHDLSVRSAAKARAVDLQFSLLSSLLFENPAPFSSLVQRPDSIEHSIRPAGPEGVSPQSPSLPITLDLRSRKGMARGYEKTVPSDHIA